MLIWLQNRRLASHPITMCLRLQLQINNKCGSKVNTTCNIEKPCCVIKKKSFHCQVFNLATKKKTALMCLFVLLCSSKWLANHKRVSCSKPISKWPYESSHACAAASRARPANTSRHVDNVQTANKLIWNFQTLN